MTHTRKQTEWLILMSHEGWAGHDILRIEAFRFWWQGETEEIYFQFYPSKTIDLTGR